MVGSPSEVLPLNPFSHPDGFGYNALTGDSFNIQNILFTTLAMICVNPFLQFKTRWDRGETIVSILYLIFGLIVTVGTLGFIIWFVVSNYYDSRACPDGFEKFIVQRDIIDFINPEYTIYGAEAPLFNVDSEKYPPAVRVEAPLDEFRDLLLQDFSFQSPVAGKDSFYKKLGFKPFDFKRDATFTSLFYPSYKAFNIDGSVEADIIYPVSSEEATVLGLLGLEKRYIIRYKEKIYVTTEDLLQVFKGTFVKTLSFYEHNKGDVNHPEALIKVRQNALGREGLYTVCIKSDFEPELKELLFATVIAYDQHVIKEAIQKNSK